MKIRKLDNSDIEWINMDISKEVQEHMDYQHKVLEMFEQMAFYAFGIPEEYHNKIINKNEKL